MSPMTHSTTCTTGFFAIHEATGTTASALAHTRNIFRSVRMQPNARPPTFAEIKRGRRETAFGWHSNQQPSSTTRCAVATSKLFKHSSEEARSEEHTSELQSPLNLVC